MSSSADATLAYGIRLYDIEEEHGFLDKFFGVDDTADEFDDGEFDGIDEIIERVELPEGVVLDRYGYYPDDLTGAVLIIAESKSWAYDYGIKQIQLDLDHGVDWNAKLLEAYQVLKNAAVEELDLDEPGWLLYASYG